MNDANVENKVENDEKARAQVKWCVCWWSELELNILRNGETVPAKGPNYKFLRYLFSLASDLCHSQISENKSLILSDMCIKRLYITEIASGPIIPKWDCRGYQTPRITHTHTLTHKSYLMCKQHGATNSILDLHSSNCNCILAENLLFSIYFYYQYNNRKKSVLHLNFMADLWRDFDLSNILLIWTRLSIARFSLWFIVLIFAFIDCHLVARWITRIKKEHNWSQLPEKCFRNWAVLVLWWLFYVFLCCFSLSCLLSMVWKQHRC